MAWLLTPLPPIVLCVFGNTVAGLHCFDDIDRIFIFSLSILCVCVSSSMMTMRAQCLSVASKTSFKWRFKLHVLAVVLVWLVLCKWDAQSIQGFDINRTMIRCVSSLTCIFNWIYCAEVVCCKGLSVSARVVYFRGVDIYFFICVCVSRAELRNWFEYHNGNCVCHCCRSTEDEPWNQQRQTMSPA